LFQVKPGVERDQFLEVWAQANDWLQARPGFRHRELLEDESGQWIELIRWATLDDALAAAAAIEDTEIAAAIMDAVVPETIRMLHPRRVATYGVPLAA
jgi:hypothetical protein